MMVPCRLLVVCQLGLRTNWKHLRVTRSMRANSLVPFGQHADSLLATVALERNVFLNGERGEP